MAVSVPLDDARAARLLGRLASHLERFPKAFEANKIVALNRTGKGLNTESIKMLTQRYAAKRADIQRKISVTKASAGRPLVMIRGEGRPIHLGLWPGANRSVRKNGRRYRGWATKILKSGSGRKIIKGGFGGISSKNQHFLIYKREGESQYPIHGLYGPSMIGYIARPGSLEFLRQYAENRLTREIQHGAEHRLKKLGAL